MLLRYLFWVHSLFLINYLAMRGLRALGTFDLHCGTWDFYLSEQDLVL